MTLTGNGNDPASTGGARAADPRLPIADMVMHAELRNAFAPAMLAGLIAGFEQAVREEQAAINRASESGDAHRVAEHAHRLASASAQFGFPALAAAARALEAAAAAGDADPPGMRSAISTAAGEALAASAALIAAATGEGAAD